MNARWLTPADSASTSDQGTSTYSARLRTVQYTEWHNPTTGTSLRCEAAHTSIDIGLV
jgi:hypothetical protein